MKRLDLSLPQLGFIAATRAALGAGLGLLAGKSLPKKNRRYVGAALVAIGALATIPAFFLVRSRLRDALPATSDIGI